MCQVRLLCGTSYKEFKSKSRSQINLLEKKIIQTKVEGSLFLQEHLDEFNRLISKLKFVGVKIVKTKRFLFYFVLNQIGYIDYESQ